MRVGPRIPLGEHPECQVPALAGETEWKSKGLSPIEQCWAILNDADRGLCKWLTVLRLDRAGRLWPVALQGRKPMISWQSRRVPMTSSPGGASLIREAQDVLDAMLGASRSARRSVAESHPARRLRMLQRGAQDAEPIASDLGFPEGEVTVNLATMETLGYAERRSRVVYLSSGLEPPPRD